MRGSAIHITPKGDVPAPKIEFLEIIRWRRRHPNPHPEVFPMIRWNARVARVAVSVAAFVSLAIASGAGARWS